MGIFEKFVNVLRSNINSALDKAEDPKKMAAQAIIDLEEKKRKAHRMLVLAKGRINLAKKDLSTTSNEQEQVNIEEKLISTLSRGISAIDSKILQLKSRMESGSLSNAQAQKDINESSAFDTFDRMEKKIESEEFEIEALNELLNMEENEQAAKTSSATLQESKLDPKELEHELNKIKRKLNDDS